MNFEFIDSANIVMFPSGFRGSEYNKSKFTTEENLIRFAQLSSNQANNNQCYQDPYNIDNIIIYLRGYYFSVPKAKVPGKTGEVLYASIKLLDADNQVGYVLAPVDNTNVSVLDVINNDGIVIFKGLGFSNSLPSDGNTGTIAYVQVKDENGLKYQNLKFDASEIRSSGTAVNIETEFHSKQLKTDTISFGTSDIIPSDTLIIPVTFTGYHINQEVGIKEPFDVNIEAAVDIDTPLHVGADDTKGGVFITSAGDQNTMIEGQSGGYVRLPNFNEFQGLNKNSYEKPYIWTVTPEEQKIDTIELKTNETPIQYPCKNSWTKISSIKEKNALVKTRDDGNIDESLLPVPLLTSGEYGEGIEDKISSYILTTPKIYVDYRINETGVDEGFIRHIENTSIEIPYDVYQKEVSKNEMDGIEQYPILLSYLTKAQAGNIHAHTRFIKECTVNPLTGRIYANQFMSHADTNLKTNFRTFQCTKSILDLPIYKFDYKVGTVNQVGCKAEDLKNICPELVSSDDKGNLIAINESALIYPLIQEVKKLQIEIEELKNR